MLCDGWATTAAVTGFTTFWPLGTNCIRDTYNPRSCRTTQCVLNCHTCGLMTYAIYMCLMSICTISENWWAESSPSVEIDANECAFGKQQTCSQAGRGRQCCQLGFLQTLPTEISLVLILSRVVQVVQAHPLQLIYFCGGKKKITEQRNVVCPTVPASEIISPIGNCCHVMLFS